jgi:hypothetical protein
MPAALRAPDGRVWPLPARCVIGSGAICHVIVPSRRASYVHALLAWGKDEGWSVADLGSKNGTTLNGRPVPMKESVALDSGDRLVFGATAGEWVLEDAEAPGAFAQRLTDGATVEAVEGTLLLPCDESPEAALTQAIDGEWTVELRGVTRPARHDEILTLTAPWRLYLPPELPPPTELFRGLRLCDVRLTVQVVGRHQNAQAILHHPRGEENLGRGRHWLLLAALGDALLFDEHLPPAERGFRGIEMLAEEVGIEPQSLHTYATRVRRRLARAGVEDADDVIDARTRLNQRRLVVGGITVSNDE